MNAVDFLTESTPQMSAADYLGQSEGGQEAQTNTPAQPEIGALQNFGNAFMKGYGQLGSGILGVLPDIAGATGGSSPQQVEAAKQAISGGRKSLDTQYPTREGISRFLGSALGQTAPAMLVPGVGMAGAAGGLASSLANVDPAASGTEKAINAAIQVPAGYIFNKATNGILQGIGSMGSKVLNAASGIKSPLVEAYEEAGITPRLAGDVSESPFMRQIQATASKLPLGAGQIENAAHKTLGEFGDSVNDLANKYGPEQTLQEAGSVLQKEGQKWLENFKTESNSAWQQIDKDMANVTGNKELNVNIPMNNTSSVINGLKLQAGGNKSAQGFLTSGLAKNLDNIIKESEGGGGITATPNPDKPLQWSTVSALRTRVGEYLQNPSLIADAGQSQAKMLYGALTKDMENGIFQTGDTDLWQKFQDANKLTSNGHQFIDSILNPITKANPEQAAKSLLSSGVSGGSDLAALRQQMPKGADALASVSLRRTMAGASEGASGNEVSPVRWLSNQDPARRLAPEAYQALYPSSETQSKLSALDQVAHSMRETAKFTNNSNSGSHIGTMLALSAPIEGAIAGASVGGPHGAILGGLAGSVPPALGYGTGFASTSPALTKFLSTPSSKAPFGFVPSRLGQFLPNALSQYFGGQ